MTPNSHNVGPSQVCGAYLLAFKPGFRQPPPSVFHMQTLVWFDLLIYLWSNLSDQTRGDVRHIQDALQDFLATSLKRLHLSQETWVPCWRTEHQPPVLPLWGSHDTRMPSLLPVLWKNMKKATKLSCLSYSTDSLFLLRRKKFFRKHDSNAALPRVPTHLLAGLSPHFQR